MNKQNRKTKNSSKEGMSIVKPPFENHDDFVQNIYLDSDSTPSEADEWFNIIETKTFVFLDKTEFLKSFKGNFEHGIARTFLFNSISYRIKYDLAKEYDYIELLLKFKQHKNIIGELLTFNISNRKYELNIPVVEKLIKDHIDIPETLWRVYQTTNLMKKKPRLRKDDISLLAYQEVVKKFLSDKTISENKACYDVYNELDEKGLKKKFSEFTSFKVSFRDWSDNIVNRLNYPELQNFIIEKKKRRSTK